MQQLVRFGEIGEFQVGAVPEQFLAAAPHTQAAQQHGFGDLAGELEIRIRAVWRWVRKKARRL
jgi:hypothetical protein